MRRTSPRRAAAVWAGVVALACLVAAAPPSPPPGGGKGSAPKKPEVLKVEETVGDLAKIPPLAEIRVEGVGLVIGLDQTGSEAQPGVWRNKLLDQMKKARVANAERILASRANSLVLVRGKIPAGITTEDVFDVEIELPPGSTTTSLAGGLLMRTDLFIIGQTEKGDSLEGQKKATVHGPILTGAEARPDDPRLGRVLGGARVKKDEPYILIINEKRKSFRTAALIQAQVNNRFNRLHGNEQEGMANAKTDEFLTLNIPRNYHHNQYRYFQVVENLPVVPLPELTAARLERWGQELLDPKTAGVAAIRLEGLGRNASGALRAGLASAHPQVRYFAAEALAYLGDEAGVDVLADAAANRPEFRAYALAALAAMDQPASSMRLQELMAHAEVQVRYGAFNALRIADKTHPALGQIQVREDEPEPDDEDDGAMAMKIAAPRRKAPRRADPFELYVVDCEGPPLVHVARTRRCEIVLFGKRQKLQTPAVLGAGPILINAADGDAVAHISRIGSEAVDGPDQKVTTHGLELEEILCTAANLGATYPEILAILQAADRQKNLPGTGSLVVDALPTTLAAYEEAQVAGRDTTVKEDPDVAKASAEGRKAPRKGLLNRMFRRSSK